MEVNRRGLSLRLIVHPIMFARRQEDGELVEFSDGRSEGMIAESFIHAEIGRAVLQDRLAGLANDLMRVLGDVRRRRGLAEDAGAGLRGDRYYDLTQIEGEDALRPVPHPGCAFCARRTGRRLRRRPLCCRRMCADSPDCHGCSTSPKPIRVRPCKARPKPRSARSACKHRERSRATEGR